MGIFARWRERFPIIKFLTEAQKTVWYPILFAALCIIGGTHNYKVYIPILWLLLSMHLFSVLFADDNKVFLTPLCMIFFALGYDSSTNSFYETNGDMLSFMHPDALGHIIAIAVIGVGSFIVRLILDGSVAAALKKRRAFTVGIIAMDIAFLLNGALSTKYNITNLGYGALLAMGFTVVYFLVSGMLEKSQAPCKYACTVMLCNAYSALIQILIVVYRLSRDGLYFITASNGYTYMNKIAITLGWGVSNVVGAVFVLGIPAAMYLARNCKFSFISFFSCPLFILGTLIINCRNSMVVSILFFFISAVVCSINGKNRVKIRCFTALSIVIAVIGFAYALKNIISLDTLLDYLRIDVAIDSGRSELFDTGIKDFLSSPSFGVGFSSGVPEGEVLTNNFYSKMYHCILIQIPAAMGILGCVAFLIHIVELSLFLFKEFSLNKLLILLLPLMIIALSFLDNFFFYPHFQIFYGVFLAVAEKIADKTNLPGNQQTAE